MARSRNVRVVVDALEAFTEKAVRKLTLDATANLIEDTPVDTGWARANWVPSIGRAIAVRKTEEADPAIVPGQRAQQQASIARVSTTYRLKQGSVFISNNVPYIVRLNEGSSDQAPSAFVQSAITRAALDLRTLR
jgi:hypothetical protein